MTYSDYYFPDGYNSNLLLIYAYVLTSNFSRQIFEGSVISSFIFLITGSNVVVGSLTGLNGFVQLLCSPISGYLADKYARVLILKAAGFIGLIAMILTFISIVLAKVFSFIFAMTCWGIFWSFISPTIDALLADTISSGNRSQVYTIRLTIMNTAQSFGPLIQVLLFIYLGNTWTIRECQIVMVSGLVLFLVPISILFLFKNHQTEKNANLLSIIQCNCRKMDAKSQSQGSLYRRIYQKLPSSEVELSESTHNVNEVALNPLYRVDQKQMTKTDHTQHCSVVKLGQQANQSSSSAIDDNTDVESLSSCTSLREIDTNTIATHSGNSTDTRVKHEQSTESHSNGVMAKQPPDPFIDERGHHIEITARMRFLVPLNIAMSDIITGLASGMTIKFFPIYFMNNLHMSPIAVSSLYSVC